MDVEITKQNGDSFRLSDYDIVVQDFNVGSVPVEGVYGTYEGRIGTVDYGAEYGQRLISVPFYIHGYDMLDYPLLRDELFGLITTREPFYIRELRRPTEFGVPAKHGEDDVYVGGKRYLVRISGDFDLEQQRMYGFGEMAFETVGVPFAESLGTSMDIHNDGINATSGLWEFGMGLEAVDEKLKYRHIVRSDENFRIFNPSNIPMLHPFECDLKIKITRVIGSSKAFQINNLTNGSRFWTNIPIKIDETLAIDGHFVTKNNLNILRDTGRSFIWLSPGWNTLRVLPQFSLGATVEFDFTFYYL